MLSTLITGLSNISAFRFLLYKTASCALVSQVNARDNCIYVAWKRQSEVKLFL